MRFHTISAVFQRNLHSYFAGVLGYLFIVAFVFVAALTAFNARFFANNLANLDQLSGAFPLLLLFLAPAITMGVWSDERKTGTEELLFTLPASDLEVLLGKYLAVLAVYTVTLAFSLTQLFVLAWVGDPDWGVIFATYVGYWLAGAALLTVGMFASVLTSSATVAFVLGALFCAVPVFGRYLPETYSFLWFEITVPFSGLTIERHLRDFTFGIIPLTGVFYFAALAGLMLYLNVVFITKRHWASDVENAMGVQYAVRTLSIAATLISLGYVAEQTSAHYPARFDLTGERLYTLSKTTRETVKEANEKGRNISIQAFVSADIPREFVHAKKQYIGLLRQYERLLGGGENVRLIEVKPNSEEAREAEALGIEGVPHESEVDGKTVKEDVYMGAVVTSNLGEVTIPFIDGETAMEYELTRSLGTVTARKDRLTVGMLTTDARFGDFRLDGRRISWIFDKTLERLAEQYTLKDYTIEDVEEIVASLEEAKADKEDSDAADKKGDEADAGEDAEDSDADEGDDEEEEEEEEEEDRPEAPDVLIVAAPETLTDEGQAALIAYLQAGHPALILADPLPFYPFVYHRPADVGVVGAPWQPRPTPDSPLSPLVAVEQAEVPPLPPDMMMQMQRMPPQFQRQMMESMYRSHPESRPRFKPKADRGRATGLQRALGIEWNTGRVVFDVVNPHRDVTPVWPEYLGSAWPEHYGPQDNALLFLSDESGTESFSEESPITAGLSEMLFFYAGGIRQRDESETTFTPLLRTSDKAGPVSWINLTIAETNAGKPLTWHEVVRLNQKRFERTDGDDAPPPDLFGGDEDSENQPRVTPSTGQPLIRLNPRLLQSIDEGVETVAAHITSGGYTKELEIGFEEAGADEDADEGAEKGKKEKGRFQPRHDGINVIFVADYDFVSDVLYEQQEALPRKLDNLTFLFNSIETLAGEPTFVKLRNRRPRPRTLTAIQEQVDQFRAERAGQQQKAEAAMRDELEKAQERLEQAAEKIERDEKLGIVQKLQMTVMSAESEQRRFDVKRRELERKLEKKIAEIKAQEQAKIEAEENWIRFWAVILPPLPALLLGVAVLITRFTNERAQATGARRVK